jgi:uncharacterized protein with PQ loop repeat
MWQDYVIAIVSLLFGFILLPQLIHTWRGKTILNLYTASLTTVGLFILAGTFFTLQFWLSFIADVLSGVIWFLLFLFSLKNKRKPG